MRGSFQTFLDRLGEIMETSIKADLQNSCTLRINDDLDVQLELDRVGEYLTVGIDILFLEMGPFRNDVFFNAMKANGVPQQRYGTLSFVEKTGHFFIHHQFFFPSLEVENFYHSLSEITYRAHIWKKAIMANQSLPDDPGEVPPKKETSSRNLGL